MNEKEINVPEGLPEKYWDVWEKDELYPYSVTRQLCGDLAAANRDLVGRILELESRVTELGLNDQQLTTRILELQEHLKDGRDYAMKQDKQINELKAENGLLEHQLKIMGDRSCNTCKYKRWRSYMGPCVSCVNQDKWKGR
jgi:uncharacterized protein (DUF2252 family)